MFRFLRGILKRGGTKVAEKMVVNLGDKVRDRISGFEGIAYGISVYLQGCRHICIKSQSLDKDGKPMDGQWFDEPQVEILERGAVPSHSEEPTERLRKPGGSLSDNELV